MSQTTAYTPQQKRSLHTYRIVLTVEIVAIAFLVVARWIWGGWWIDWNKNGSHLAQSTIEQKDNSYNTGTNANQFVPPEFDPAAVDGVPTVDDALGWAALSISEDYNVHVCGILNADADGSLPLYFTNDAGSTVWAKLRVLNSSGEIIGETGLLKAGQYVERVQLNDKAASGNVTLQVMGYQPDTYYSAGSVGLATVLTMAE